MWQEDKHPRDWDGRFTDKEMMPAEKIASVKIKEGRDNILPKFNDTTLPRIGQKKNKNVIVKASIIERNKARHGDVVFDTNKIIGSTLYSYDDIFVGNKEKLYYTFIKFLRLNDEKKSMA